MNSILLKSKVAEIVYNYLETKYQYNEYFFSITNTNTGDKYIAHLQQKKLMLIKPLGIVCTDIPLKIKRPIESLLTLVYDANNGLELHTLLVKESKQLPGWWSLFNELKSLNIYLNALIANTKIPDIIREDYTMFKSIVLALEINIANLMVDIEELKKTIQRMKSNPDSSDEKFIQDKINKYTTALAKLRQEQELNQKPNYSEVVSQLSPCDHQHFDNTILDLRSELLEQDAYTRSLEDKLISAQEIIETLQQKLNGSHLSTNDSSNVRNIITLEPPVIISAQNASYRGTAHREERVRIGSGTFFRSKSEASSLKPSSLTPSIN